MGMSCVLHMNDMNETNTCVIESSHEDVCLFWLLQTLRGVSGMYELCHTCE